MPKQHSFIFPIATLKEEVEKRTSYLGKMRGTQTEPHLLDRLSLTDGESFLTDEFLDEAAVETYDWIKAFGRNVSNAYKVYPDGELKRVVENEGVRLTIDGVEQDLSQRIQIPLTEDMYIVKENEDEGDDDDYLKYDITFKNLPSVKINLGEAQQFGYSIVAHYSSIGDDDVFENQLQQKVRTIEYNADDIDGSELSLESITSCLLVEKDEFNSHLQSIESVEIIIENIEPKQTYRFVKGDYVQYVHADGREEYGIVDGVSADNTFSAFWIDRDIRGAIVYNVELPDWTDVNMLPMVERNLKEALVNYIIYRWFEMVMPKEVEQYREQWTEKAHQAQLGLNTERRVLQRPNFWLH